MARAEPITINIFAPAARLLPAVIAVTVGIIVLAGWLASGEEYITPDNGIGYWLGIYGSAAMLTLLIYSYRKRNRSARVIGSIPFWFRTHMLLGVAGPVLILFHANFRLGPVNSNIALISMLLVAFSGVVGRYIYGKIHVGLHGQKVRAEEILADIGKLTDELGSEMKAAVFVQEQLNAFGGEFSGKPTGGALESLRRGGVLAVRVRLLRARLLSEADRLIRIEARASGWSWAERRRRQRRVSRIIKQYSDAALRVAELAFYERLFALWHVLHLPLFFLMMLAGIVHVWAVHLY